MTGSDYMQRETPAEFERRLPELPDLTDVQTARGAFRERRLGEAALISLFFVISAILTVFFIKLIEKEFQNPLHGFHRSVAINPAWY